MKLPDSYYNNTSYAGSIIAGISFVLIAFMFIISFFFDAGGNYLGVFMYMALPALLVLGLVLIPIGMYFRYRRIKNSKEELKAQRVYFDLSNKKHRNAAVVFIIGTVIFLVLTGIGSYEAFHFTESNQFCGTLCHKVMEPEYTTYQTSSHARVKCVECHVGPGADFFVKSKLSGLYQVYSVLRNIYPRPIETPITSLRPARETCEQCHWPQKFFPNRVKNEIHYLADSANTRWDIALRLKIGPTHTSMGHSEGIHWHINKDIKVEYIPMTEKREFMSWVRYINLATGDTIVYEDTMFPLDEETKATAEIRTMDCMDCHNRPSHQFLPPQDYVDKAIAAGEIPVELPGIKQLSMEILNQSYETKDTAFQTIRTRVYEYYKEEYPKVLADKKEVVEKSVKALETVYAQNNFPHMKANWDVYPSHISHIEFNGCFRCHNGNHESADGQIIRKDCNLCHTIIQQGTQENMMAAEYSGSLEFKHPVDIGEDWKYYACTDCHRYLY